VYGPQALVDVGSGLEVAATAVFVVVDVVGTVLAADVNVDACVPVADAVAGTRD
jgi:hypothetical protein